VTEEKTYEKSRASNGSVALLCVVFVGCMVGMAYAAVPLYQLFCQVTGYNGTTQRAEQYSDVILDQKIRVTFDANTSSDLNWDFRAVQQSIDVKIGETVEVKFVATNRSATATTGSAVFNVTPMDAAAYFNKVECFCFTKTTLEPGQVYEMPVVFYVDPEIVKNRRTRDLTTLTLSYTFYPAEAEKPVASLQGKSESGASGI
jgi:cytochrome c oxidase assembly protein subunit 11